MKRLIIIALLFTCAQLRAQVNYVLNPSFEQYSQCPNTADQIHFSNYWTGIDSAGNASCTPEFCHACSVFGATAVPENGVFFQHPHSGDGLSNMQVFFDEDVPPFLNYYRDYLQGRLYSPLTVGVSYCVTFYVSLADESNYAIDRIGAYLDDGSIDTTSTCGFSQTQYTPQVEYSGGILNDTMNWTRVEGTFTANGTEKFITIGNFYNLANTANINIKPNCLGICHYSWMVVDDVSVIESNLPAFAGNDTTINDGDSLFLGRTPEIGLECKWYVNGSVIDSGAGIWAHPAVTTTYVVEQTLCGLVKTDTVVVTVLAVGVGDENRISAQKYTLSPNPNNGNMVVTQRIKDEKPVQALILNGAGQQVQKAELKFEGSKVKLNLKNVTAGVYMLLLTGSKGETYTLKFTVL